jgi:hypothetical protein
MEATTNPFHKKKEKTKVENNRPVSHLVEMGKLVEYIVGDQILEHFITNGLIHQNHHGSLKNHSTATALILQPLLPPGVDIMNCLMLTKTNLYCKAKITNGVYKCKSYFSF